MHQSVVSVHEAIPRLAMWQRALRESWPFGFFFCLFVALLLVAPTKNLTRDFLYLFLFAPFLFSLTLSDLSLLRKSSVLIVLAATLSYVMLTHAWGPEASASIHLKHARYLAIILLFLCLSAWLVVRSDDFLDRLFWWMGWAAVVTAVVSFALYVTARAPSRTVVCSPGLGRNQTAPLQSLRSSVSASSTRRPAPWNLGTRFGYASPAMVVSRSSY